MKNFRFFFGSILIIFLLSRCGEVDKPSGTDGWLKGDENEKFETVANQLRGFDMAMVETGYRYQELYWAGKDENWEYAFYQSEKIKVAIESGLERRPKRAGSAKDFLDTALPDIQKAISSKDTLLFNRSFSALTSSCIACHAQENVSYMWVKTPEVRQSPIRK
jgi:hypothetical protein